MKLLDYIRGLRKGKEAHRLEKESMSDPFLADAMDGYHQVEGKHEERIKELQAQITSRSAKKRNSYAITWSIAACLIIGFGISSYLIFLKKEIVEDVFIAKETTIPTTITPDISKEEVISSSPSAAKMKQDSTHVIPTNKVDRKEIVEETIEPIIVVEEEPTATDTSTLHTDVNMMKLLATAKANNILVGKVTDNKGQPLIGVNISYGRKGYGTITDINGKFSIPKERFFGNLELNYIGYDPVRIKADTNKVMLIAMNESSPSVLDEVVITGYGAQKKRTVIGAVTSVNVDSLKAPASSLSSSVAGSISNADLERLIKASRQIIPEPVIGMKKYQKYLKKKLIRPTDETCNQVKGKVVLTFLVDQRGRPFGIMMKKGLCESADKEAIRLIQEGPDWTLGKKPVEITVEF